VHEKRFLCKRILYFLTRSASGLGVTLHTLSLGPRHSLPHGCYPRQVENFMAGGFEHDLAFSSTIRQVWYHSQLAAVVTWCIFSTVWPVACGLCMSKFDTAHTIADNLLTNFQSLATYELGIFLVGTLIFERYWTMPSGLGHRLNWRPIVRPVCSGHNHNRHP